MSAFFEVARAQGSRSPLPLTGGRRKGPVLEVVWPIPLQPTRTAEPRKDTVTAQPPLRFPCQPDKALPVECDSVVTEPVPYTIIRPAQSGCQRLGITDAEVSAFERGLDNVLPDHPDTVARQTERDAELLARYILSTQK